MWLCLKVISLCLKCEKRRRYVVVSDGYQSLPEFWVEMEVCGCVWNLPVSAWILRGDGSMWLCQKVTSLCLNFDRRRTYVVVSEYYHLCLNFERRRRHVVVSEGYQSLPEFWEETEICVCVWNLPVSAWILRGDGRMCFCQKVTRLCLNFERGRKYVVVSECYLSLPEFWEWTEVCDFVRSLPVSAWIVRGDGSMWLCLKFTMLCLNFEMSRTYVVVSEIYQSLPEFWEGTEICGCVWKLPVTAWILRGDGSLWLCLNFTSLCLNFERRRNYVVASEGYQYLPEFWEETEVFGCVWKLPCSLWILREDGRMWLCLKFTSLCLNLERGRKYVVVSEDYQSLPEFWEEAEVCRCVWNLPVSAWILIVDGVMWLCL